MAQELEPDDVHAMHPSLAALEGRMAEAKQGLDGAAAEKDYSQKRVKTAKDLMSDDLDPFKNKGEKMFKVLYDGIGVYDDKELQNETFSIMLEKDSILSGTYIDNKTVLFGEPYNVYCSAINVEPTDLTHSEYNNNLHEYDQTVIINVEDFDQLQAENNDEDANESSDFVVVDEEHKSYKSSTADSEFEAINVSDAQTQSAHSSAVLPIIPPPAPTNNFNGDEDEEEEEDIESAPKPKAKPPPVPTQSFEEIEAMHATHNISIMQIEDIQMPQKPPKPPIVPLPPPYDSGNDNDYDVNADQQQEEEQEEEQETAALVQVEPDNNNNALGMPPPPGSASVSPQTSFEYQKQMAMALPPPAPSDAVLIDDNEEFNMPDLDRLSLDDINNEYNNMVIPTTGNLLEDLDNLLRIYRNLSNEKEREMVYTEFWHKYDTMYTEQAHLLLSIPTRVRGFLSVMNGDVLGEKMEAHRRDRIMTHVLSRNGLLQEPDYIRNRYLYTYFIQFEIFNYFKWFVHNCCNLQAWMFLWLWLLMIAQIIHIGIDFGGGNPWRAVLMQCLVPLTFIASIQFVNTPFTANILRPSIENKCAALCTVYGRVSLNILILFFCLGSLQLHDVLLLFCALLCGIWTTVIFVSFSRLKHASNYVRIATGRVDKLQEKFNFANETKDGVLTHNELRNFFKSYNQIVPMCQIDLMISQYDIFRDNGLRFDALRLWFEKIPVHHLTRTNLLAAKSTFDLKALKHGGIGGDASNVEVGGSVAMPVGSTKTDQIVAQSEQIETQYTAAEKEWLGLAGKKYMNQ